LPLEDVYTRLKIVSRRKTDFQLQKNDEVAMYDIFNTVTKGEAAMALVVGSPGIGKTTFCLKIAYDWANEKIPKGLSFPEFEIVLLLKCRDINEDIMKAINEQLMPEDETVKKELIDYIQDIRNQESILIILDGLDEVPQHAENHVDRLLHRRIFPFCFMLVTSRQERGIKVRQNIPFDVLLQIEGFEDEDAFEYIRKHFRHFGPEHWSKGERLIQAIQENSFLHALPSNPLNLLLLCVVFEDYEGDLPSGRTELYQIIVRCLLRRFCAKHDLKVPEDDKALEEQFEDCLLALGELAWLCLLEDRFSFSEGELARYKSINKDLVARRSGLVFMEASMKRIKPQHEYHFLHKTFQEYLAAFYLALKILRGEINVLSHFQLDVVEHVTVKYRQVFLFVCGILGEKGVILFRQIGEKLKSASWQWLGCGKYEATFFTECFIESRNTEQIAIALSSYLPFPFIPYPQTVEVDLTRWYDHKLFFKISKECKIFSKVQHPFHLIVSKASHLEDSVVDDFVDFLASCPKLETFSFSAAKVTETLATALMKGLSANSTLLSFTFRTMKPIPSYLAVTIGNGFAASKTLTTVTFQLTGGWCDGWASALEKGLSADTPLKSVVLKMYDKAMNDKAMRGLKTILINAFLTSIVLTICGDMQDSLAIAVGEGLSSKTVLKSFSFIVFGKLSQSCVTSMEKGFLRNSSLDSLEVKVFGELPDRWTSFVTNVSSTKTSMRLLAFHPNVKGYTTDAKVACLCAVLPNNRLHFQQSLTLNLWGELSRNAAESLGRVLKESSSSRLTINIYGSIPDVGANILTNYLRFLKTPSYPIINIWGELSRDGNAAFQELTNSSVNQNFGTNVHQFVSDNCPVGLEFSIDVPSALPSIFAEVEDTGTSKLTLTINRYGDVSGSWILGLGDSLAGNTSITTLALTINNYSDVSGNWMLGDLDDGLARYTSLTSLTLTINNYGDVRGYWVLDDLGGPGLVRTTSLTSLALTINNFSDVSEDWTLGLGGCLARNTSLTSLTLTINNYGDVGGDWELGDLDDGLARNTSLTTLALTINNYSDVGGDWTLGLGGGLARNTSLTSLTLTINNYGDVGGRWELGDLDDGLARNTSLTTLALTINNYSDVGGNWTLGLGDGLARNRSLTTLTLTINNYGDVGGNWMLGLGGGLARNTSLSTFTLTFNNYSDGGGNWMLGLGSGLARNTSLTTFTLTINNYSDVGGEWMLGDLAVGLARNTSLTTFTLTFNNYSDVSGDWMLGDLGGGLARNTSITTLTLTFNNYSDGGGNWMLSGLGDGLAGNTSLTTLTLTFNNYSDGGGNWMLGLGDGLARNTSLTTLTLTINNYSDKRGVRLQDLGVGLAKCKSLTTLSLAVNSCSGVSEDQLRELCNSLAKSESSTTLRLTVNDHIDTSRGLGFDISSCFVDCKSLTLFSLTVNLYGEPVVRHDLPL